MDDAERLTFASDSPGHFPPHATFGFAGMLPARSIVARLSSAWTTAIRPGRRFK
jgi:hypothetical protein